MKFKFSSHVNMAAAMTFGQLITAASAFLVNLLSSSVLLPNERGVLALLLQITYLLAVIATLGMERPFLRDVRRDFQSALRLFVRLVKPGLWTVVLPIGVAGYFLLSGHLELTLVALGIAVYIIFNTLGKGVQTAAIAASSIKEFFIFVVVIQCGMLVISTLLVLLDVRSSTVWYFGYILSGSLVLLFFLKHDRSDRKIVDDKDVIMTMRKSGIRLLPASLGNTAMLRSDRFILPLLAGTAQLGIYTVIATVMEIATWPVKQWVDTSLYRWSQSKNDSGIPLSAVLRTAAIAALFAAVLSAGLAVVAYLAVVYLLPEEYLPATDLIFPLGIASVIYSVSRTQQGMLIAEGYSGRVSTVEIFGMVASLISYFLFIPQWGATGAAYGSVAGYSCAVVAGIFVQFLSRRR